MTLERRQLNLTMELGGRGQGCRECQRMTILESLMDGQAEKGEMGRERLEQNPGGGMVQAVFTTVPAGGAGGVW